MSKEIQRDRRVNCTKKENNSTKFTCLDPSNEQNKILVNVS